MADGKHCPACGVDIGVWPIFSAGLPNLIRCPRCKARLAYPQIGALLLVLLLVFAVVAPVAYFVAASFEGIQRLVALLVIVFGAWVPIELVVALYLRDNKTLEYRSGGAPPAEKDTAEPGTADGPRD
jgi:hypothetical protein